MYIYLSSAIKFDLKPKPFFLHITMSASPTSAVASAKRPFEDPSSPAGLNDMPDAKRQALDKAIVTSAEDEQVASEQIANGLHPTEEDNKTAIDVSLPAVPQVDGADGADSAVSEKEQSLPIPSTASTIEQTSGLPSAQAPTQDESQWIHIRSVISSSEAATVIGKGGENVTQIRRSSGAKCTVSDYSRGAVERILTVSGAQDAVAKVRSGEHVHLVED